MQATVLLIDDDPQVLEIVGHLLAVSGYRVLRAAEALQGLGLALAELPDLVLADIRMPVLDGFGLLAALRANRRTSGTPFLFLTALDERDSLQHAIRLGADGYLLKPLQPQTLLDTVANRLSLALARKRVAVPAGPAPVPPPTVGFDVDLDRPAFGVSSGALRERRHATVLYSDIRRFSTLSEMLPVDAVADILNDYYTRACEVILRQQGVVVKIIGDAILALFEPVPGGSQDHAGRAMRAGLLLAQTARDFGEGLSSRYALRGWPGFAVGVGVHTGEVLVCSMGPEGNAEVTVIGDTVNIAQRLESKTKELRCDVVASAAAAQGGGARFSYGRRDIMSIRGRQAPVPIVEVTGFAPRPATGDHGFRLEMPVLRPG